MSADAIFALAIVNIPVAGALVALGVYWIPRWQRRHYLRKLDEMFERDQEWWEEQLRGLGDKRPPE